LKKKEKEKNSGKKNLVRQENNEGAKGRRGERKRENLAKRLRDCRE
jgi:hypothetical protein